MIAEVEAGSVDIPLDKAQAILTACLDEARRQGVLVSAAVVDAGGNLKAFARMDGAEVAGPTLATDKAYTALAHRTPTHELAAQAAPGGPLFGLHANGGGRYVIFGGGIPIASGGRVIGAVGVSGAAVDQDVRCAQAGIGAAARLLAAGRRSREAS
ncbi:MAG TPA: heme-binding protein [Candidatus Limnocylindrales bacterium]|nr:heme-binding protein [Candidatus Limnocylindrales bacterium]